MLPTFEKLEPNLKLIIMHIIVWPGIWKANCWPVTWFIGLRLGIDYWFRNGNNNRLASYKNLYLLNYGTRLREVSPSVQADKEEFLHLRKKSEQRDSKPPFYSSFVFTQSLIKCLIKHWPFQPLLSFQYYSSIQWLVRTFSLNCLKPTNKNFFMLWRTKKIPDKPISTKNSKQVNNMASVSKICEALLQPEEYLPCHILAMSA